METEILLEKIKELADIMVKTPPFGIPDKICQFVNETNAGTAFILFVANDGVALYKMDEKENVESLLRNIWIHDKQRIKYLIYEYDVEDLGYVLTEDLISWAFCKFGL